MYIYMLVKRLKLVLKYGHESKGRAVDGGEKIAVEAEKTVAFVWGKEN